MGALSPGSTFLFLPFVRVAVLAAALALALEEALTELEHHDDQAAQLVKLRYFAGLTHQQAAEMLGITRRAADRLWALARAWLHQRLGDSD